MNTPTKAVLVLGGTGKTGSRVAARLAEQGQRVRIASRHAILPFDWESPFTWASNLDGMEAVYISFQPDLAVPGAADTIRSFSRLAVEQGVKKLVLLSGRGEPEALQCEEAVKEAGGDWTIVRASWFMQNFSEGYMLEPVLAGYVVLPVGDVGEPFVDADDIADVAVAALTGEGHSGKVYEVTGPRLLSFSQAVEEIGKAAGKTLIFDQIPQTEYQAMLKEYGVPEEYIGLLNYLFSEVLDGRNAHISHGVEEALGRPPRDFADYARRVAEQGVWNQALPQD